MNRRDLGLADANLPLVAHWSASPISSRNRWPPVRWPTRRSARGRPRGLAYQRIAVVGEREQQGVERWQSAAQHGVGRARAQPGVVTGDDILARLDDLLARGVPLANMDTGRPLAEVRDRVLSANAGDRREFEAGIVPRALEGGLTPEQVLSRHPEMGKGFADSL